MDLPSPFNVISLCSGNGTGDLALKLAVPTACTRLYVEREAHAIRALVRAMEENRLAQAAVWSDVKTFDGRPYRGSVDCIVATYPCQPFSCAGKRLAEKDPRHLWPDIARIIGEARPPLVFLENVRGHLRRGFQRVCEDLREMGYETRAGLFSAEEVGTPHGRIRLFALAYAKQLGIGAGIKPPLQPQRQPDRPDAEGRIRKLADPRDGLLPRPWRGTHGRDGFGPGGAELAIPAVPGLSGRDDHTGDDSEAPREPTAERRGTELAEPKSRGFGVLRQPPGDDRQPKGSHPELADPSWRIGSGQDGQARSGRGTCGAMHDLDRPFPFPPYRTGDWDRWRMVLETRPWLRPALGRFDQFVLAAGLTGLLPLGYNGTPEEMGRLLRKVLAQAETEHLLRRMADGVADQLEFSRERIDRIRAVGLGITPITMAFAFCLLAEAHGINFDTEEPV